MTAHRAWDGWGRGDRTRRASRRLLDSGADAGHSALVPPGALHQRVTAALASWRLDDAEALLADTGHDPSPYVAGPRAEDQPAGALGRAWADTLRAELLVRRLRVAGFTLLGDRASPRADPVPPLDLHAVSAEVVEGGSVGGDGSEPSAGHAALALALVRSAKVAFEATADDLQRAAGLARHARIELLSRRVDAAMDEAVEAAGLLDLDLPPSRLLVDTLATLAGVLADLELMPLALDYQRRAHQAALSAAADPAVLGPGDGGPEELVAGAATRLGELCAELGESLLDDGDPDAAAPRFAEAAQLAEQALALLPAGAAGSEAAAVVRGWALVGLGQHRDAGACLDAAVGTAADAGNELLLASAELALGRALRRQGNGDGADEHLTRALALADGRGLPRLRRAALRELSTLHAERDDADRALPYLQAYVADELDRVDERRTRWVELFGRRKSLLETERAAGQLRREAYEDPLTHLPNRRYAEARLDRLLSSASSPALAVIDVDRFKSINDAVGHPGGDAVLRAVAQLLVAGVRDTDEVCRWAGDEFVILLADTTAEQAEGALERIRRSVAASDWTALGLARPVTISVGIASAARGDDRRTLFAAADAVLYDAKRSGRDRVVRLATATQARPADPQQALAVPVAPPVVSDPADGFAPLLADPLPPLGPGSAAEPLLCSPLGPVVSAAVEPRVLWASGRGVEEVLALVDGARLERPDRPVLVLRADAETLVALAGRAADTTIDPGGRAAAVGPLPPSAGRVAVLCSAECDRSVAAEAAFAVRVSGGDVAGVYDVAAGQPLPPLDDVDCLLLVTGPDTASVAPLAAAVDLPVVAVPTSAGRPGALAGLGPLLALLAAAPGVAVSAADDGAAAALFAARVARRAARHAAR